MVADAGDRFEEEELRGISILEPKIHFFYNIR